LKIDDLKNPDEPPIILTSTIQRDLALVKPLLVKDESFIIVGPEGCGKNLVIRSLIKQMKST
jgi:dynein heavy chain 2